MPKPESLWSKSINIIYIPHIRWEVQRSRGSEKLVHTKLITGGAIVSLMPANIDDQLRRPIGKYVDYFMKIQPNMVKMTKFVPQAKLYKRLLYKTAHR